MLASAGVAGNTPSPSMPTPIPTSQTTEPAVYYTTIQGWVVPVQEGETLLDIHLPGDEYGLLFYLTIITGEVVFLLLAALITCRWIKNGPHAMAAPGSVQRSWAQIRQQRAPYPAVLACAFSVGIHWVLRSLLPELISLTGIVSQTLPIKILCALVTAAASPYLTTIVYRLGGGLHCKSCAIFASAAACLSAGSLGTLSLVEQSLFVGLTVWLEMLFHSWAAHARLPDTLEPFTRPTAVGPRLRRLGRSIFIVALPLALVKALRIYVNEVVHAFIYPYRVANLLSRILLYFSCMVASVFSVKREFAASAFKWHWPAYLTPAVALAIFYLGICAVSAVSRFPYSFEWQELIVDFTVQGACGLLGAYAFLIFAERFTPLTEREAPVFY